jgi:hypothetical protein
MPHAGDCRGAAASGIHGAVLMITVRLTVLVAVSTLGDLIVSR